MTPLRLLALTLSLSAITACDDSAVRRSGSSDNSDDNGGGSDAGGTSGTCQPIELRSADTASLSADTSTKSDRYTPSCIENPTAEPDALFQFTAPVAGYYAFSTTGSAIDTVLTVLDGVCGNTELGCNDDDGSAVVSKVGLDLTAGQVVTLVVDGVSGAGMVKVAVSRTDRPCNDDHGGVVDCSLPTCAAYCTGGEEPWPAEWASFEVQVLQYVNEARAVGHNCDTEGNFGPAGPLTMHELLRGTARRMSKDMGERAFFDHVNPDGDDPFDRMGAAGYQGGAMGENIAAGQDTPRDVVDDWLDSDGHCRNIMDPDFHVIGVGYAVVPGSPMLKYWTQNFGDTP